MDAQLQKRDSEIGQLNNRLNEMNGLMKDMFGQLSLIATAAQHVPRQNPTEPVNPATEIRNMPDAPPNIPAASAQGPEPSGEVTQETRPGVDTITKSQVEDLISQRVKAVIASENAELLVGKGRPYPAEYDRSLASPLSFLCLLNF